ncbi:MAG: CoA-transferase [Halioglobus sp.]|nr:CoA-transferase [Halioglobus sp.]
MDKQMTAAEVVAQLQDGMTLGIGGWGPRRKPMALVREILRSDLRDLTLVSYGGADVGMLCAAGRVKKVVFAFVSWTSFPWNHASGRRGSPAPSMCPKSTRA